MTTGQNVKSLKLPSIQMLCYVKKMQKAELFMLLVLLVGLARLSHSAIRFFFLFFVEIVMQLFFYNHEVRTEESLLSADMWRHKRENDGERLITTSLKVYYTEPFTDSTSSGLCSQIHQ